MIKIRKNATDWYKGSRYRRREVREYRYKGYDRWSRENGYGMRLYWTQLELDNLIEETCLYRHTSQQVRITVTHPEVIDR